MPESFFVGREQELKRAEEFVLNKSMKSNPGLVQVWGNPGIGKSAFLNKFSGYLLQETDQILWFYPKLSKSDDIAAHFFPSVFRSVQSNNEKLESTLGSIRQIDFAEDDSQNIESFWTDELEKYLKEVYGDQYQALGKLTIVFILDDFQKLSSESRNSFCIFINKLSSILPKAIKPYVFLSSEDELMKMPNIFGHWEASIKEALDIQLDNLTKNETGQLLDLNDIDPNSLSKIYNETHGIPSRIIKRINEEKTQTDNPKEWYNRGSSLMLNFNHLQRKWLAWAAALKFCNDETLSFLVGNQERNEALNWVHSHYPVLFKREKNDYSLTHENRKAVIAYLEKEDPKLFKEIDRIIKKYIQVKNTIPKHEHRVILSKLSAFNYFDVFLIKKLFPEEEAERIISLLEKKPIFFREENQSYRLASNIKTTISSYNSLLKQNDITLFQNKAKSLWQDKAKELNQNLENLNNELKTNEQKNNSITISMEKMNDELERLKQMKSEGSSPTTQIKQSRNQKSGQGVFLGIVLQIIGIAILYVDILVFKKISFSYISIAALCIMIGILYSLKGGGTKRVQTNRRMSPDKKQKLVGMVKNLEIDLNALASQREGVKNQIRNNKEMINNVTHKLSQSYLPTKSYE